MKQFSYIPRGVCASRIDFSLEDGILYGVSFEGGCDGNLRAIGKLLEGTEAEKAVALLRGNRCGRKNTSCADQLAIAIGQTMAAERSAES